MKFGVLTTIPNFIYLHISFVFLAFLRRGGWRFSRYAIYIIVEARLAYVKRASTISTRELVGLSNILDRELRGRKPAEGPHREVV